MTNDKARKSGSKKRMNNLMKKVQELTILCNLSACLIFFNREDNKLEVWPSHEKAKSHIEEYYSSSGFGKNKKTMEKESEPKANMEKIEKKLADSRKVIAELEMNNLMLQTQNGYQLDNLSLFEFDKLISHSNKKITMLKKAKAARVACDNDDVSSMVIEIQRAPYIPFQWGRTGLRSMGCGSNYLLNRWFSDETPLAPKKMVTFDLNLIPVDVEDNDMNIYEGESSKIDDANNA